MSAKTQRTTTTLVAALMAATLAASCGDEAVMPEPSTPTAISVSPASVTLRSLDQIVQLTATVTNQHGQVMSDVASTWTSSDPATVTVDASGLVTAVANGTAEVTATAGSASGIAKMTVAQVPAEIAVDPDSLVFTRVGDTARVAVAIVDANGHAVADAEVVWTSGDPSVATVDDLGLVTAVANGPTAVTATAGSTSGSAKVTVGWPDSVAITIRGDTIGRGKTLRLAATAFDEEGLSMGPSKFLWTSSDTSVARVDKSGLVTARAEGRAIVTAALGPARGTAEITVWHPERAALAALYSATDGPNWRTSSNWLTDAPLGRWYGVDTDESGRVVRVVLKGYIVRPSQHLSHGLSGALPPELGDLEHLQELDLAYNNLTGAIPPELGSLSNLRHLYLYYNDLTGPIPRELGAMTNLRSLNLIRNSLTGPIPRDLANLVNLEELGLGENGLTGRIPPWLGDLSKLQKLSLILNDLEGSIPPELGNLTYLSQLSLFGNDLTGTIPAWLGDLSNLRDLHLHYNGFTGLIPPEIGNLANVRELMMSDNNLTGSIPPELGNLTSLESLFLEGNKLTGPVPPELGSLSRLEWLMLGRNRLTAGIPPELGDLSNLQTLGLSENPLSGPLPLSMTGLTALSSLWFHDTKLCVPENADFESWLAGLDSVTTSGLTCGSGDRGPRILGAMAGQGPLEGMATDPGGVSLLFDARIRLPVRVNGVTVYERGGGAGRGAFDLLGQTRGLAGAVRWRGTPQEHDSRPVWPRDSQSQDRHSPKE